jgi:hypothetical protein
MKERKRNSLASQMRRRKARRVQRRKRTEQPDDPKPRSAGRAARSRMLAPGHPLTGPA